MFSIYVSEKNLKQREVKSCGDLNSTLGDLEKELSKDVDEVKMKTSNVTEEVLDLPG